MSRRGRDEHETISEYYELGVSTVTKDSEFDRGGTDAAE